MASRARKDEWAVGEKNRGLIGGKPHQTRYTAAISQVVVSEADVLEEEDF